ncbi:MAG TPA: hypothetical protein VK842_06240, partial [bacterium]|nr:hypothetical protein [bacterium]
AAALAGVTLSQNPYDPGSGPLLISHGSWSCSYNGRDGSGAVLRNGLYFLVLTFNGGAPLKVQFQVLGKGAPGVVLSAGPNPCVGPSVTLRWFPAVAAQITVHAQDGSLVRDLGLRSPPLAWNLSASDGRPVAAGVYLLGARVPGQRSPSYFKLAVLR